MSGVRDALKNAALTALVTLGLAFPIVAYRTEPDAFNRLVLNERWALVAAICAATFALRLAISLYGRALPRGPAQEALEKGPQSPLSQHLPRIGLALLIAYPFLAVTLTGTAGSIKWIETFGAQILLYILLGWGLNIIVGLAGLLDLGYVAFYAVGAYTTALLTKTLGVSFWLALPAAGLLAACWGLLVGLPVLRLRGDYLAIVTLAFAEILRLVLINWVPVTGGYAGISSIPKPTLFGLTFTPGPDSLASVLGLPPSPLYRIFFLFYLALGLALLAYWVTVRLRKLPVGRAWEAMREDEIACRSLGINTVSSKLSAMAAGAFFGGIAGSFFAAQQGFISPKSFEFNESALILIIVVLGGMGSNIGIAIAATAVVASTELLRELTFLKAVFGDDFEPTQYRMLLFGLALVLIMIVRPKGLISTREPSLRLPPKPGRVAPPSIATAGE
ncbi:MAG: high-affinity branched-chain amino acid ABC transporter permease LivM [Hyphomicrobium sp.]|jgi:branched-chain amino acid transport system permease protein